MALSATIEAMFAAATKKLHRDIDHRAQLAAGRSESTANRSVAQLYGAKERMQAEYEAACLRG